MAFAPPRRPNSRQAAHRRGSPKQSDDGASILPHKTREFIEARHREWLAGRHVKDLRPTDQGNIGVSKPSGSSTEVSDLLEKRSDFDTCSDKLSQRTKNGLDVGSVEDNILASGSNVDEDMSSVTDHNTHNNDSHAPTALQHSRIAELSGYNSKKYRYDPKSIVNIKIEDQCLTTVDDGVNDKAEENTNFLSDNRYALKRKVEEMANRSKSQEHNFERPKRPDNHFCPVCKTLMTLSGHDPFCLIPCGHTMCEVCVKKVRKQCPVCSHDVQTTTSNILLLKIIRRFSEENGCGAIFRSGKDIGAQSSVISNRNIHDPGDVGTNSSSSSSTELRIASDPRKVEESQDRPNDADVEKWTEQLAAVEMRISVMDLQARLTSTEIVNARTRFQESCDNLKKLEAKEAKLQDHRRLIDMQLQEIGGEKKKAQQKIQQDKADAEKQCEQLNLINYTKAGLEGEMEKLRQLLSCLR